MASYWSKVGQALGGSMVLTLFLLCPAPALAHKLYVFAQVEGNAIQGRAYFPGDVPAQESVVIARDPSGRELGRTTTDNEGKFTFPPREHVDFCLTAETPDGHSATYVVHASELPDNLPGKSRRPPAVRKLSREKRIKADLPRQIQDVPTCASRSARNDQSGMPPTPAGKKDEPVGIQLTELRKQIQELRRQIFESDQRLRFRDFLGGIGFILGLAGVAFYMKARGKRT